MKITKLKKYKLMAVVSILALVSFIAFASVKIVKADNTDGLFGELIGNLTTLNEQIKSLLGVFGGEQKLGAYIASPTGFTDVNITNDLVVDGLATLTGAVTFTGAPVFNNSSSTQNSFATAVSAGTMANATNTLFCVLNPFSATSTVDFAGIYMTGYATSTHSLVVATSTVNVGLSTSTLSLATSLISATNVTGTAWVSLQSGVIAANFPPVLSYAVPKMLAKPNEYVCGVAGDGDGKTDGVTNSNNTFAGTYKLRWYR